MRRDNGRTTTSTENKTHKKKPNLVQVSILRGDRVEELGYFWCKSRLGYSQFITRVFCLRRKARLRDNFGSFLFRRL